MGLEYANHSLGIEQLPTATTNEYYRQFVPYPVLGVGLKTPLTDSIDLESRLVGTYLRSIPTPFNEGGRIKMSVGMVDARATMVWKVTDALSIDLGGGYLYFDSELRSGEDGNELRFYGPAISLGLTLSF